MIVHRIMCGMIKNNNFILEKNGRCLIIDLSDFEKIDSFIKEKGLIVDGILLTHSHWDHLMGVEEFVNKYNVPIYLGDSRPNYTDNNDFNYTKEKYNVEIKNNFDIIHLSEGLHSIGDFNYEIINTPGHTFCSVVYYFKDEELMFTGDFLFRKTIGITYSKNSDKKLMVKSLIKITPYPDSTKIFPGHGPLTKLGREKVENKFLLDPTLALNE